MTDIMLLVALMLLAANFALLYFMLRYIERTRKIADRALAGLEDKAAKEHTHPWPAITNKPSVYPKGGD